MTRSMAAFAALFLLFPITGQAAKSKAEKPKIDPKASELLKKMSDYLASQEHMSFSANSQSEIVLKTGQKLEFDADSKISVDRPDRLRSDRKGEVAENLSYIYDGKNITLYGEGAGLYATTPAPDDIDQAIDFTRDKLNIDAPAADLLYSDPFRILTEDVVSGSYIGKTSINGTKVHHLAFRGHETDWQIWIAEGDRPVPVKYVITSKNVTGQPEFTVAINDWDFSPDFDKGTFSFSPPKKAHRIPFAGVPESNPSNIKKKKERS